jgi:putative sulfotransferase
MIVDRFVVGTGRCGSTLLSRMLAEHPDVLSIFEFFNGLDMTKRFRREPMTGGDFAALLSSAHPFVTMVLSRGYAVEEITYPFERVKTRYKRTDNLPWLLVSTLPRLTDDPDALFDDVIAFARDLPEQQPVAHYRCLFEWLMQRFGRLCWIERSGSSIDYLVSLHELFPGARFLHLHRDGHESALSMREHAAYRLAIYFLFQRQAEREPSIAELEGMETGVADDASDPISRALQSRPPVELYGRYWSQELEHGYEAIAKLPVGQYAEASFEELVANPRRTLRRIADFFELDGKSGWIERAAALVRGVPPARFDGLPAEEQERLQLACMSGMELLSRA